MQTVTSMPLLVESRKIYISHLARRVAGTTSPEFGTWINLLPVNTNHGTMWSVVRTTPEHTSKVQLLVDSQRSVMVSATVDSVPGGVCTEIAL